ncbi:MAG: divergent polysaccharide deacetylase family protein, partial [Desulfobacterales bacterium]|nr:divergent polysaccharide deacetylase family protein [Desulfobacterales bacterium]
KARRPTQIFRLLAGLSLLVLLILAAAWLAHHTLQRKAPPPRAPAIARLPEPPETTPGTPTFEIYPKEELPPPRPPTAPPKVAPKTELPRVAIIIDDLGYDRKMAARFLDLDIVLTFSIFPHSPFGAKISSAARRKGLETMLHLPMEPLEYPSVNPGPGALLTTMSPDELLAQLQKNLDDLPAIVGVNNHMGSRMTTVSNQLYQIFSILKKKELYFVDSRTTAETLCEPSARLLQIPFAQRDVFLDHVPEADFVRRQIERLVDIAQSHGEAVGIAHPHEVTYRVLKEMLPELRRKVRLVPASEVVHVPA